MTENFKQETIETEIIHMSCFLLFSGNVVDCEAI